MKNFSDISNHAAALLRAQWRRLPPPVRQLAPFAAVLLLGLALGFLLSDQHDAHEHDGHELVAGNDDGAVFWTCSMHPQVRQAGPGKCPLCGMDLIPVSTDRSDDHGDLPRLTVSERAAALMAVEVWPVERRSGSGDVSLFGQIDYDETLVHDVVLRAEGQVERLYVNFANAPVQRGQRLAEIYSPAILTASQELLQARRAASRGGAAELVEAAAMQLLLLGVSQAQIDQILESGQPARSYTLFSPAGGVVAELTARQGEWLMNGARLMRVAGQGRLWVQFEAYESDLGRLQVGSPLRFTVESFPGETFEGRVAFIDPVVSGQRRTARVRVAVPNPAGRLKPGMLARGRATTRASAEAPLVVPASAPLVTGRRAVVYVQLPGFDRPTFEAREVSLGGRSGAFWEVQSGLEEGELVVTHGAFKIDSELQIRGRPSMMSAGALTPAAAPARDRPVTLADDAGRQLENIVTAYLDLAGALSQDDVDAARRAAARLEGLLRQAELAGLEGAAGRDWNRLRREMTASAASMQAAGDLQALRRELLPLSQRMEIAVQTYRSEHVGPLFRAMCPMVNGGEGTWLTRRNAVENPYHGESMFRCGEVQERVVG
jgi:membrane fusion protein, copper/silver efflux system